MSERLATQRDLAASEARSLARLEGHEMLCAERMRRIDDRLSAGDKAREVMRSEMRSGFSGVYSRLWWAAASIIALQAAALGWFLMTAGLPGPK